MLTDSGWFVFLLVVPLVWLLWAWWCRQHLRGRTAVVAAHVQQLLKPRTPDDCPACRQHVATTVANAPPPVTPWSALKSRRGAPKRIDTQGFACPNHTCTYYQITDVQIHAPLWGRHPWTLRAQRDAALPGLCHHLQHPALLPSR
jgi:hypothetical protein